MNGHSKNAVTTNMTNKNKTSALILTAIVALSCLALLTAKPVDAQNGTAPSVTILYPADNTAFNVSIEGVYFQVLYQTNDKLSWVGFSVNGGANVTCTGNVTDSAEFINDGYQFDFGHPTLTLYANDTAGNWATPQTVTYTVNFYADTYPSVNQSSASPSPSPAQSPISTSTVPELSRLAVAPLLIALLSVAITVKYRRQVRKALQA